VWFIPAIEGLACRSPVGYVILKAYPCTAEIKRERIDGGRRVKGRKGQRGLRRVLEAIVKRRTWHAEEVAVE
jgi:hypothetical protein